MIDKVISLFSEKVKQSVVLVVTWIGIIAPLPAAIASFRPGGVADTFREPLLTPAPWAFIIWLPIYLGLLALAVYQALPAQETDPRLVALRPWLAVSAVLNALWLSAVAADLRWSPVLIIFALLAAALVMRRALGIGVQQTGLMRPLGYALSIYAGWLTLAVIVNTSSALLISGWVGNASLWAVIMLIVGTGIGLAVRAGWRDPVYGGVFVWTLLAIVVAQWGHPLVVIVAALLALITAATLIPAFSRK